MARTNLYYVPLILSIIAKLVQEISSIMSSSSVQDYTKRFEYMHSFRKPTIASNDGKIFLWDINGNAIANADLLRLAPSITSQSGIAWNTKPMVESEFWQIDMEFRITGRGSIGADGLALWYTASPGTLGNVFGSNDGWVGLGIFFDSFQNSFVPNKNQQYDAPFVTMMLNDGTRSYDHAQDGGNNLAAKCRRNFRNTEFPVKARITYLKNTVTVSIANGVLKTPQDNDYELCFKVDNVFLPKNGYFGLSAATGGLADDHDVSSFEVFSFQSTTAAHVASAISAEERRRQEESYRQQQEEFKRKQEQFQQEHPEKFKIQAEQEALEQFEDPQMRRLRAVHEGQQSIFDVLKQLDSKLDQLSQAQQTILQTKGLQPGVPSSDGSLQRHEVNEIIQASRELTETIRDLKITTSDIQSRVIVVDQRLTSSGAIDGSMANGEAAQQREALDGVRQKLKQILIAQRTKDAACASSSCLSSTVFMIVIMVQTVLLLILVVFRGRNEKAKFY